MNLRRLLHRPALTEPAEPRVTEVYRGGLSWRGTLVVFRIEDARGTRYRVELFNSDAVLVDSEVRAGAGDALAWGFARWHLHVREVSRWN